MQPISVECTFSADGHIQIRRIKLNATWISIEQGRQWADESGRHVLVMLHGRVQQLTLQSNTLTWHLHPKHSNSTAL